MTEFGPRDMPITQRAFERLYRRGVGREARRLNMAGDAAAFDMQIVPHPRDVRLGKIIRGGRAIGTLYPQTE